MAAGQRDESGWRVAVRGAELLHRGGAAEADGRGDARQQQVLDARRQRGSGGCSGWCGGWLLREVLGTEGGSCLLRKQPRIHDGAKRGLGVCLTAVCRAGSFAWKWSF